jgi:hypothetical protein
MTAIWNIPLCSRTGVDLRFRGVYCLYHHDHHPDDGDSTHLWNVGLVQQDYRVLYPRISHLRIHRLEHLKSHIQPSVLSCWLFYSLQWSLVVYLKMLSVAQTTALNDGWLMKRKGYGRKWSSSSLNYYLGICLWDCEKPQKPRSGYPVSTPTLNLRPHKYNA